jgi:hypothetical protein
VAGSVDEFRVYDEARTTAQVTTDRDTLVGGGPKVTVDRTTGLISLTNTAASVKIFNYSINSPSGSLLTANMRPISGRVDEAANGGNGTFDNNDAWDIVANTNFQLSEADRVGEHVECYLDDVLVHSFDAPPPAFDRLFVSAARDEQAGEVILKVVNAGDQEAETTIKLPGAEVAADGKLIALSGEPDDENSPAEPNKIVPVDRALNGVGAQFTHSFSAHSLTVLRLKAKTP